MSLSKDIAQHNSVSSSACRTTQGQWYDFYDFTELQNSFWQLIGEIDPRSCCARRIEHWKPKASGQAGVPGIAFQEELEDDDSIIWIFPDQKWLPAATFVPVVGLLAGAGGAPVTIGMAPLVLCGFPAITFQQVLAGSVGCTLLFVAFKWISARGEDDSAEDLWCWLAVGPALFSALANLVVAAHPVLGFGAMNSASLLPLYAFLSLPGGPLQILAVGCLAADEKWKILPVAACDLLSSLCTAYALQSSPFSWVLLLQGGVLLVAVGNQLIQGFPERAQNVSALNQIRVQSVGDFLLTFRGITLTVCALGALTKNPAPYCFPAVVAIDFVAKVGAGHLLLKDKDAMTSAMRVYQAREEHQGNTPEAVQPNQRAGGKASAGKGRSRARS